MRLLKGSEFHIMKKIRLNKLYPYLFIAPFFLIYIAFSLFPVLYSFSISLTKWNGVSESAFVGFSNYVRLFTSDPLFWQSILNTVILIVIAIPLLRRCPFGPPGPKSWWAGFPPAGALCSGSSPASR